MLQDRECFFATRGTSFTGLTQDITARITVRDMSTSTNTQTRKLKPLLSNVDENGYFYEVYGVRIRLQGSSDNLFADSINYVGLGWALLWCSILTYVVFEREVRELLFILSLSHTDRNSCSKCTIEMHARMHTRLDDENSNTNARTQVPPQLDSRTRAVRSMLQDLLSHSSFQVLLQAEQ